MDVKEFKSKHKEAKRILDRARAEYKKQMLLVEIMIIELKI